MKGSDIIVKTDYEIKVMQEIGNCIAEILDERIPSTLTSFDNTMQLAEQIEKWLEEKGITSIKNFSIDGNCVGVPVHIAIDNILVHGIPSYDRKINNNSLIRVDLVGFKNGMYSDAARTYIIGEVSEKEKQLVEYAYKCLKSLSSVKLYDKFSKISRCIEKEIISGGFATSSSLTGHGIGAILHDYPAVYNFYNKEYFSRNDFLLQKNMTFAIEPLLFEVGSQLTYNNENHEIYVKSENSICAHVENTYLMCESGLVPITSKV